MNTGPSADINGSQTATIFHSESYEVVSSCGCLPCCCRRQKFGQFQRVQWGRRNLIYPSPAWGELCRFYRIEQLNTGAKLAVLYVPPTAQMNFANDVGADLTHVPHLRNLSQEELGIASGSEKLGERSDQNRFKVVTAQIEDYRPNTNESAVSKRSLPPILNSPYDKSRWKKRQPEKKKRKKLNTTGMLKLIVQPTFTRIRRENVEISSPEVVLNSKLKPLDRRPSNQSGLISPIGDKSIRHDVPASHVRRHSTISDDIETLPDIFYSHPSTEESHFDQQSVRLRRTSDTFDPSGIVLFFIHGVGGCALVWRKQIVFFKEKGENSHFWCI